jgi:hypothetical protein
VLTFKFDPQLDAPAVFPQAEVLSAQVFPFASAKAQLPLFELFEYITHFPEGSALLHPVDTEHIPLPETRVGR